jgi:hypothetical protein
MDPMIFLRKKFKKGTMYSIFARNISFGRRSRHCMQWMEILFSTKINFWFNFYQYLFFFFSKDRGQNLPTEILILKSNFKISCYIVARVKSTPFCSKMYLLEIWNKRRDRLTMDYFDNLDNEYLNKYKKKFKMKKKIIDVFFYF